MQEFLDEQSTTLILAKEAIEEAQERQARNADVHGFKVGDQVLLNTENVTVDADRNRPTSKLSARFVGPYTIVEQHTPVSFRLELPPQMRIHDIFHVDRFRPYQSSPESLGPRAHARPPPDIIDGQEEFEAESILEHRTRRNRQEFLVLWKDYPREDATWEPASNLAHSPLVLRKYKRENGI